MLTGQHYMPDGQHYMPANMPGQHWLFIHVTWHTLDQSRSHISDRDITKITVALCVTVHCTGVIGVTVHVLSGRPWMATIVSPSSTPSCSGLTAWHWTMLLTSCTGLMLNTMSLSPPVLMALSVPLYWTEVCACHVIAIYTVSLKNSHL